MAYIVEILLNSGVRFTLQKLKKDDFEGLMESFKSGSDGTLELNGEETNAKFSIPWKSISFISYMEIPDDIESLDGMNINYPDGIKQGLIGELVSRLAESKSKKV